MYTVLKLGIFFSLIRKGNRQISWTVDSDHTRLHFGGGHCEKDLNWGGRLIGNKAKKVFANGETGCKGGKLRNPGFSALLAATLYCCSAFPSSLVVLVSTSAS